MRSKPASLTGNYWAIPIVGGAFVALTATFILRLSYVWSGLFLVGLTVVVGSLVTKDFKSYWLAIFALSLPLEIVKALVNTEYLREITSTYVMPLGEMPIPIIYLSDLPFIILVINWLFEIINKKQKVYFPKSNWLALAFIGWSALSLINAQVFSFGFFDLLRTIKFYLIYLYIANNINTEARVKNFINFLLAGVVFQGLVCLYQFISRDVSYIFGNIFGQKDIYNESFLKKYPTFFALSEVSESQFKRASGTVGPTNAEAQYFELLLPLAFLLWITAKKFRDHVFTFTTFFLGLGGLIVTFSRGGLIGFIVGVASVLLLSKGCRLISNKIFLSVLIISLLAGVMAAPKIYHFIGSRPESNQARFHLYKVGLSMVKTHPFLGVGLNNHLVVAPDYDPDKYFFPMPTHNQYIFMASEVGIPGIAFFLGFMIVSFIMALRAARSGDLYLASVAVGILGAFIAISVHNIFDHFTYHTNLTLIWIYGGLSASLGRMSESRTERNLSLENRTY